jgi:hypothetical protein
MVHRIVLKFEQIWLSPILNSIRKPRKPYFLREKGPYLMNGKWEMMALNIPTMCVSLEQTRQHHFDISLTCSRHGIAEEFFTWR